MACLDFVAGDYQFLAGAAFSEAVIANQGFCLHRVRFAQAIPMAEGFERLAEHLQRAGRPGTALAACELRSPAPQSREDFNAFNQTYLKHIEALGCKQGDAYPVTRSNMAPLLSKPSTALLYAFTYTEALSDPVSGSIGSDFVIAGKPENRLLPDGSTEIVGGEASDAKALIEKARYTLDVMMARVQSVGASWESVSALQIYCPVDIQVLWSTFEEYGLAHLGLHWYPGWPPVKGMVFEIDVRRTSRETVLDAF